MVELPGLSGASPIGFLAALGMLRLLAEDRGHPVRLAWRNGRAVLGGLEPMDAIEELAANMMGRADALEFTWTDSTRGVSPEQYRDAVARAGDDQRALGFLAGWGTDTVIREGSIAGTHFDMTSGQQKLLRDLRRLAPRVNCNTLKVALLGGSYERQSPWGLDPASLRSRATEAESPTKSEPPGKPGLIWLAFESIPLHPVVPVSATRVRTVGWRIGGGSIAYVWPLWDQPLMLDEVMLLRTLPVEKLAKRPGVAEVWVSERRMNGKYPWLCTAKRER